MKDYCDDIDLHYNEIQEPILLDDGSIVSIEENGYEVIDVLTREKLEQATSVVYNCKFNGNPWNFNMECEVSNNGIKANVIINYGFDFAEHYVFNSPINKDEYNNFLSNISSQNVMNVIFKNNDSEGGLVVDPLDMTASIMMVDGLLSSSLIVKHENDVLFIGVAGENLSLA